MSESRSFCTYIITKFLEIYEVFINITNFYFFVSENSSSFINLQASKLICKLLFHACIYFGPFSRVLFSFISYAFLFFYKFFHLHVVSSRCRHFPLSLIQTLLVLRSTSALFFLLLVYYGTLLIGWCCCCRSQFSLFYVRLS